jgi:hypothetical protein
MRICNERRDSSTTANDVPAPFKSFSPIPLQTFHHVETNQIPNPASKVQLFASLFVKMGIGDPTTEPRWPLKPSLYRDDGRARFLQLSVILRISKAAGHSASRQRRFVHGGTAFDKHPASNFA